MPDPTSNDASRWIGVDLGGSGFRAWRVAVRALDPLALEPVGEPEQHAWSHGRFEPVPLADQLLERQAGGMSLTASEASEARDRIGRVARAILALAGDEPAAQIRVAVATPGLRVKGGRGLGVVRNGPRCPDLCGRLADRLAYKLGARFASLEPLAGDGLATACGERAALRGSLRGVRQAYSLAGGSGLAEAFVIGGRPRELDGMAGVEKAWQARSEEGESFEDALAPARINARFAELAGSRGLHAEDARPEPRADAGDERARELLSRAARAFAALVELRAEQAGGLERVVVGQALARMLASAFFREQVVQQLALRPALRAVELCLSELRAAPALGAVALAVDAEQRRRGGCEGAKN